jgi:uncharacterized membrane protein
LFVGFSIYTTLLYESFWMTGADFGTYVHMFSTTLQGEGFLQQGKYVAGHPNGSYWGGHFSLTLLGFLPLYALLPSPITLLVAKSFVLAASIPMVWLAVRNHVEDRRFVDLLTASYALNPFLWSAWIYDFQEHVLLPILVFATYHAYYNERYRLFLLFYTLVLFTNELMVLIGGGFLLGLAVAAYRTGRLRSERWVFAAAIGLTIAVRIISGTVISRFSRVSGIREAAIAAPIRPFIEGGRATTGELVSILFSRPSLVLDLLATDITVKVIYLCLFLAPVLFLAIFDESTIGALAPFLGFAWLFTGTRAFYTFDVHYPLYLIPFIYIGSARIFERIAPELPPRRLLTGFFVVILIASAGAGAQSAVNEKAVPAINEHTRTLSAGLDTIPDNASLVTQNTIYPHVATRPNATFVPNPSLFDVYQQQYGTPTPQYVVFDTQLDTRRFDWSSPVRDTYLGMIGETYGIYRYEDGIWILKRGYDGPPRGITQASPGGRLVFEPNDFTATDGRIEGGQLVDTSGTNGSNVWHGPYTGLPPGNYTATFQVRTSNADTSAVAVDIAVGQRHQVVARRQARPTSGSQTITVKFTLQRPRNAVEFRGFRTGNGTIVLESVTVEVRSITQANQNRSRSS